MVNGAPWGGTAFPQVDWRAGMGEVLGEGVIADRTGTAIVTASGSDMEVDIRAHRAMVQGVEDDFSATSIDVSTFGSNPTSGQSRVDYIAWKYDPTAKTLTLTCVPGSPATTGSAAAPALTRSTSGAWHAPVARVTRNGVAAVQSSGVTAVHAWLGPHLGAYPTSSYLPSDAPQGATAWAGGDLYRRAWTGSVMAWSDVTNPPFVSLGHGPGVTDGLEYRVCGNRVEFQGQATKLTVPGGTATPFSTGSFDTVGLLPSGAQPLSADRHTTCRMLTASYGGGMVEVAMDGTVSVRAPAGASAQTVSLDGVWVTL